MNSYELHVIESKEDIKMAILVGLIAASPNGCGECYRSVTVPFTIRLGEDDISVSLCNRCLTVP